MKGIQGGIESEGKGWHRFLQSAWTQPSSTSIPCKQPGVTARNRVEEKNGNVMDGQGWCIWRYRSECRSAKSGPLAVVVIKEERMRVAAASMIRRDDDLQHAHGHGDSGCVTKHWVGTGEVE